MLNVRKKHKIAHKIWSIICLYTPDSKRYPNMQAMCMRYMVQKCKDTFGLEVVQGGGEELSETQIKRHKKATLMKKDVFFSQSSLYCK